MKLKVILPYLLPDMPMEVVDINHSTQPEYIGNRDSVAINYGDYTLLNVQSTCQGFKIVVSSER